MKKNISIIINSLKAGGAERVASVICNNLCGEFNLFVVLLYDEIDYDINEKVTICRLHKNIHEHEAVRILKLPFTAYKYYRLCRKNKIDLSFSLLSQANFINCFSRIFSPRYRIVISERTNETEYLRQQPRVKAFLQKILIRHLFPLADIVTANSKHSLEDLKKNFKIMLPAEVLYNPVSRPAITQKSEAFDVGHDPAVFNLLCISNFRPEKNHDMLIEAFSMVKAENIMLSLIGAGDDRIIKLKVRSLGIDHRVEFLGYQKNPFPYLKNAYAIILASDFEVLPNVILEALVCETPVISTATKGSAEILNDMPDCDYTEVVRGKYGLLVPVNNARLMAEAIDMIVTDAELRTVYKNRSRERAFDFELQTALVTMKNLFAR